MRTAIENEEYVRSRWDPNLFNGGLYFYEGARSYHLRLGSKRFEYTQKTKAECWSAAYAFTLEREEQIRQVEEEIALMEFIVQAQDEFNDIVAAKRILAREQAALAELKKGMRQ